METQAFFTPEEKKEFFTKYRALLRSLYTCLEKEDISKMKSLMKQIVAQECYGRDKNGINGLLRNVDTALIASVEMGLRRTSVLALLLYRPVYKQVIDIGKVQELFGEEVVVMIQRLLRTSDLYARNTAINSENFHHLLFSFAEDVRVILLMIADRLCLMRLGKRLSEDDRVRLATEAAYLYAPLAHRMGSQIPRPEAIRLHQAEAERDETLARRLYRPLHRPDQGEARASGFQIRNQRTYEIHPLHQ